MISGCYSQILSTSDVPFDELSNSKLKGISQNNNEGRGPITSSTVFHSLKAMQDVHLCMYVGMHVCMYIYVSQADFRLISFTAGRCCTPLILNDQLRSNGVRSSDLIVCSPVTSFSKADRDEPRSAAERSEAAGIGPKGFYEPNRTGRSVRLSS